MYKDTSPTPIRHIARQIYLSKKFFSKFIFLFFYFLPLQKDFDMKFIRPKRLPEANIQAEFYHRCRLLGLRLCLEYKYEHSRFDAVMLDSDDNIYAIIEFKSRIKPIIGDYNTKQIKKYQQYGIPIIVCLDYFSIDKAIGKCIELLNMSKV